MQQKQTSGQCEGLQMGMATQLRYNSYPYLLFLVSCLLFLGIYIVQPHARLFAISPLFREENILLDFEGSDIQNLAFFYSGFGAHEEKYAGIKLNRLPFWAKWLKK